MAEATHTTRAAPRHLGAAVQAWHVAAAFVALIASFWAIQMKAIPILRSLVADPANSQPLLFQLRWQGYSTSQAKAHMQALGNAANSYYADTLIPLYDFAMPLMLLAFGVLLILYATQKGQPHALDVSPMVQRCMLAVPCALYALHMGENLLVSTMLEMYPTVRPKVVETASMFTQLKWLAVFVESLLLTGVIVHTVHRHIGDAVRSA
jgi:hypothetical protein